MFENKNLRCRNCKFWSPISDQPADVHVRMHATHGQCRRHAPPPTGAKPEWAVVQSDDWCGEHLHISA